MFHGSGSCSRKNTSPLASKAWAYALAHMSCDKHSCPKHGQDNQIPGTLETTPPAMPFWSELSLILSLGNLARTLLHEDCSLLGGHTRCDSGYLTPPKFRRVLRRKMLRDTWVCRK